MTHSHDSTCQAGSHNLQECMHCDTVYCTMCEAEWSNEPEECDKPHQIYYPYYPYTTYPTWNISPSTTA
jgi:hypothetical protein